MSTLGQTQQTQLQDLERKGTEKRRQGGVEAIYAGSKASLKPIQEAVLREAAKLGPFRVVSANGYVSLRRRKQFVMLAPSSGQRLELGLNVKDLPPSHRLLKQPRGSLCNYLVKLAEPSEVNAELIAWIKFAYEDAG